MRAWPAGLLALLVGGAGVAAGQTAPSTGMAAQRAYADGQYEVARRLWLGLAEDHDRQAELGLALLYDIGRGVPRDSSTAFGWYYRAAAAGLPEAEFNVAVMQDAGDGVAHDVGSAATWYARAAAHGDHRAEYNLAQLYAAGEGVPRNVAVAATWLRAAAPFLPAAAARLERLPLGEAADRADASATGVPVLAAPSTGAAVRNVAEAGPSPAATSPEGATVSQVPQGGAVELVWTAAAAAAPTRFFVQVDCLDGAAAPREVFAGFTDRTATLAQVDQVPGHYAWRVYGVSHDHYAATPWWHFQVLAAEIAGLGAPPPAESRGRASGLP